MTHTKYPTIESVAIANAVLFQTQAGLPSLLNTNCSHPQPVSPAENQLNPVIIIISSAYFVPKQNSCQAIRLHPVYH